MNPRSGGGKVVSFDLIDEARRRGIEPVVLAPGDDLRELATEFRTIDVAVNRGDRPELAQVGEDRRFAEVAGVDDQVGTAQDLETAIR